MSKLRFGIIVFPGSNCDADCYHVVKDILNQPVESVWHGDTDLSRFDCLILPGGFSYGDYLRCGAVARFAPVMDAVHDFATNGGLVLGICNGFQILCEAGLLPGAMVRNSHLRFACKDVHLRIEATNTPFTRGCHDGQVLKIPIAHGEGNYYTDAQTLTQLNENGQIIFRYCESSGDVTPTSNPNGALDNIAGICNEGRNVLGMMPHPERCSEDLLGSQDGHLIWNSLLNDAQ